MDTAKKSSNNIQSIKTAYINYLKMKPSDNHIDCQVVPKKEEPKDGKRD